jgi:hypothetical protein
MKAHTPWRVGLRENPLIQTFSRFGVSFQYPANWDLDVEEAADGGWTATLQSPDMAFLLVSLRPDADDPAQVADEALDALRAEYKELDAEDAVETFAGQPAVGHDIDFLTVDTPIVCWTRCVETADGPLLVMGQASEFDRPTSEPVLKAICASFVIDQE